jgi:hypothetical protein
VWVEVLDWEILYKRAALWRLARTGRNSRVPG